MTDVGPPAKETIMVNRIHILGASGSGTMTLGQALAEHIQRPHFEADNDV
jgi:shikimate kinase